MATVSVIMPAANSAATIGEAIESVLAQSYGDWELLIALNGSQDDTLAIAEGYAQSDARIKPFVAAPERMGPSRARNAAVERAAGRYIAFLDSDDMWLPSKLDRQVELFEATGAPLVYSAYCEVPRAYDGGFRTVPADGLLWRVPERLELRDLKRYCVIGCLTAAYDAEQIGKQQMLREPPAEDYDLWLRILLSGGVARGVTAPLAIYRRANSESESGNKRRSGLAVKEVYRETLGLRGARLQLAWARYALRGTVRHLRRGGS